VLVDIWIPNIHHIFQILENIKEFFVKGLVEIESDEIIFGDNQEL